MADNEGAILLRSLSRPPTRSDPGYSTRDETPRDSSRHLPDDLPPEQGQYRDELPAYSRAPPLNQSLGLCYSTKLYRSGLITFLTFLFAGLVVYSWVILAILSLRPLSTGSWQANTSYKHRYPEALNYGYDARLYRSARVIQSILSVIILPWTSAVCAHSAVIFMQNQKDSMGLTMRQVMALADRRWLDPTLLSDVFQGAWRKQGSLQLLLAIVVHFLAAIIYPIQSVIVNSKTIHVPVSANMIGSVSDLAHQSYRYAATSGIDVVRTRAALLNADIHTLQPHLWQGIPGQQLPNFQNFSALSDPFYAQLPNGFNTGVLQQFAMRINSTATSRSIAANEFPSGCSSDTSALYAIYTSLVAEGSTQDSWAISACMPNVTGSPWVETRDRQGFSESLYLNISIQSRWYQANPANVALYEINLRTTAGYFELPNFMNNGTPGPLLESDPSPSCGPNCMRQISRYSNRQRARRDDTIVGNTTNYIHQQVPWSLLLVDNKGPLLTTALALFGPGSFLDTFFASVKVINGNLEDWGDRGGEICVELAPLMNLLYADERDTTPRDSCIALATSSASLRHNNAHTLIAAWLQDMHDSASGFPNIFTAAAFLSNKQWVESLRPLYSIYQDPGSEMTIPDVSLTGLIVISVLFGLYLLLLLALSLYGSWIPRWTHRLDSFAMLRLGAALGEGFLPLVVVHRTDDIKELDEIPGVIRDVGPVSADAIIPVNRIGLWGGKPLQSSRRYECHGADNEALTAAETNQMRRGGGVCR